MNRLLCAAALTGAAFLIGCQSDHAIAVADDQKECYVEGETTVSDQVAGPAAAAVDAAAETPVWRYGGAAQLGDADAVPAARVVADPAAYAGKRVRITGTVTDVCAMKGCWLRVAPQNAASGAPDIFIKFTDPPTGRLVPMEAVGRDVTVEGTLKQGMLSEKAARHFREDAGAPQDEIEKIVGPQKQLIVAGAVVEIPGLEPRAAE